MFPHPLNLVLPSPPFLRAFPPYLFSVSKLRSAIVSTSGQWSRIRHYKITSNSLAWLLEKNSNSRLAEISLMLWNIFSLTRNEKKKWQMRTKGRIRRKIGHKYRLVVVYDWMWKKSTSNWIWGCHWKVEWSWRTWTSRKERRTKKMERTTMSYYNYMFKEEVEKRKSRGCTFLSF